MPSQINQSPPPLIWIAGIALILFSLVGIAAFMGWIPNSIGNPGDSAESSSPAGVKAHKAVPHVASNTRAKAACAECGVIQSTRVIVQPGDGGAVGIVGGAVVGGLLGNQVGGGRGKDIATVAGAVGGAVVGNEIEKRVDTTKRYETVVRFNDGTNRVFTESKPTAWRVGEQVKVINGVIQSNN
ncbi:MAG: glycine zipper 2TM domain-containing protein [Burkholderiales bacterium]|nr:glycine zipper 2TM domain-containing protein [Burkholderiales bacterium]